MKTALYNAMSPGHLYLQRYGHPGGADCGMSLRGAGRGKLLVRAVELGAGRELGVTGLRVRSGRVASCSAASRAAGWHGEGAG